MKNRRNIIIGVIVVLILIVGGVAASASKLGRSSKKQTSSESKGKASTSKKSKTTSKNQNNKAKDTASGSLSNSSTSKNEKSTKKDSKSTTEKKKPSSGSSKDPYTVSIDDGYEIVGQDVEILKITKYSGYYYEDGSDEKVTDALALQVKNTGKKVIEYGIIVLNDQDGNKYEFTITMLGKDESVLVLASDKKKYDADKTYKFKNLKNLSYATDVSTESSKIKVDDYSGLLGVKSRSDTTYSVVQLYYKYKGDETTYNMGVTYKVTFKKVGKKYKYEDALHYSKKKSKVVRIECVK